MNIQEKKEHIRQACIKANEDIVKLQFGCHIKRKDQGEIVIEENVLHATQHEVIFVDGFGQRRTMGRKHIVEIIGRDIRLADVLLALKDVRYTSDDFLKNGSEEEMNEEVLKLITRLWNLFKDNLNDQPEETIEFIYNLLCE